MTRAAHGAAQPHADLLVGRSGRGTERTELGRLSHGHERQRRPPPLRGSRRWAHPSCRAGSGGCSLQQRTSLQEPHLSWKYGRGAAQRLLLTPQWKRPSKRRTRMVERNETARGRQRECETVASRGRPGHREHRYLEAERPAELRRQNKLDNFGGVTLSETGTTTRAGRNSGVLCPRWIYSE